MIRDPRLAPPGQATDPDEIARTAEGAVSVGVKISDLQRDLELRTQARDGWRTIATVLFDLACGFDMRDGSRTWHPDYPPAELLDGIVTDERSRDLVIARLRDAFIGRAWHVRGNDGIGTCDYPLCPNRAPVDRRGLRDIKIRSRDDVSGLLGMSAELHVCSPRAQGIPDRSNECFAWAEWVACRALAGRIQVK